jgi:tRNA(Ile)-lysidine synthase
MKGTKKTITERVFEDLSLFVDEYGLSSCRWLLAVSGGMDSMVMLHAFNSVWKEKNHQMAVAHFDHGYRNESSSDASFVASVCQSMGISSFTRREELGYKHKTGLFSGQSLEAVFRKRRMAFLEDTMKESKSSCIMTAHHQDDLLETFLMRCLRGTGLNGIQSIKPFSPPFARPLLHFSKEEIRRYAKENQIEFREDPSNQDQRFQRNRIRNELIPFLEESFGQSVRKNLLRSLENFSSGNLALETMLEPLIQQMDINEKRALFPKQIGILEESIQREVIIRGYYRWRGSAIGMTGEKCQQIIRRLQDPGNFSITIDADASFHRDYDSIRLEVREKPRFSGFPLPLIVDQVHEPIRISVPGDVPLLFFDPYPFLGLPVLFPKEDTEILMDYDDIPFPLTLRYWAPGDRMSLLGFGGRKKLSKLFQEYRVPRSKRKKTMVLIDGKNDIIWCVGIKRSGKYPLDSQTKKVLSIRLCPSSILPFR